MYFLATRPRKYAAVTIAALLCALLALAGCAPNPAARDADTQAAIADAVAATIAAQQTATPPGLADVTDAAAPTLAPPPTPLSIATATPTPAPTLDIAATVSHQLTLSAPTATPTAVPTATPRPTATPTPRPTFTPRPTATPTRRPTPTPAYRPPTAAELQELKQLMLELVNAERERHGAPPVRLGDNPSPQIHVEQALANCYSAHWDKWGFKPLYRYALTGGDQYAAENMSGIDYCPQQSDRYRLNTPARWESEVRETVQGWIDSSGHHRNLINPAHRVMHAGIAFGKWSNSMAQVFSGDYVRWTRTPSISASQLQLAGEFINGAFYDGEDSYVLATLEYHPPVHTLTRGQLSGTYCLESDIRVASFNEPLPSGWHYTNRETGEEYTDFTTHTNQNSQCVNPYELPADRIAPASWDAASAQHDAAVELSRAMPDVESTRYVIVADELSISSHGLRFTVKVNLSPALSHYGPGIYTVSLWANVPDSSRSQRADRVAAYPIWWHTQPTAGHPY